MHYNQDTPFLEQNLKSVGRNVHAFASLLAFVKPPVVKIVEAMGGIGLQSLELKAKFACPEHEAWETNQQCFQQLDRIEGVKAHCGAFPLDKKFGKGTLLILDFNLFTLKYKDDLRRYFETGAEQVVFTDCARGKFHLHPQAYGLSKPIWEDYCCLLNAWLLSFGLQLVTSSNAPRSITYFLARQK